MKRSDNCLIPADSEARPANAPATRDEAIRREIIDPIEASGEVARLIGQAADALATIARIRPEIGALLDDVGVTRDLRRALELLRADEVVA